MKIKQTVVNECDGCVARNCEKCEYAQRKAADAQNFEEMQRQVDVMGIENNIPYDRDQYVYQVKYLIGKTAEAIIEVGKRLLVMKEKEGRGEFVRIVEDVVGIPHSTAYRFMNAALKCEKFPKITMEVFPTVGSLSKVYALLEAPEEDLKELEERGVLAGRTADELQRMSVKEMRDLIKKLKTETDAIVKEEVKALETEKKALVAEVERLRAEVPPGARAELITWFEDRMKEVEEQAKAFDRTLRNFAFDPRLGDLPEVVASVEGAVERVDARWTLWRQSWDNFLSTLD